MRIKAATVGLVLGSVVLMGALSYSVVNGSVGALALVPGGPTATARPFVTPPMVPYITPGAVTPNAVVGTPQLIKPLAPAE
jgi:hypothetical protein